MSSTEFTENRHDHYRETGIVLPLPFPSSIDTRSTHVILRDTTAMYSWIDYMIDSPQSQQISLSSLSQVTSASSSSSSSSSYYINNRQPNLNLNLNLNERQAACKVAEEEVFRFLALDLTCLGHGRLSRLPARHCRLATRRSALLDVAARAPPCPPKHQH